MPIYFNGTQIVLPEATTLAELLKSFYIEESTPGIAVALNCKVISRQQWQNHVLAEKDEVEIIHAIQGG